MLLVSLADGRRLHDLAIDCPDEAEVGLVVDSILSQLTRSGVGSRRGARVTSPTLRIASRAAPPIARSERLIAADIHDGDIVSIVSEVGGSRPPRAVATLTVLSGPDQGKVLPVAPGESRIGREHGYADLVLNDPAISRVHALLRVSDTLEVADAGSTNGIEIDGRVLEGSLRIEPGQSFTIGNTELVVGRVDEASGHASLSVPFNPTPRIYAAFPPTHLEYPAPPAKPARPPIPWMSALIPVVVGSGLALATKSLLFLAFMLMSPLLIFASTFESRRELAKQHAQDMEDHEEAVAELAARHAALQEEEWRRRHEGSPVITELAGWAPRRELRLWERGASHGDFLSLRIGVAQLPSRVTASAESGGRPRARRRLVDQLARTRTLNGLPLTADLLQAGHVGIAGGESAVSLARSLVTQAAALHSPANLTIAAIVAPSSVQVWDWVKWLPHTRSPSSPLAGDRVAVHPDSAVTLVERLTELARERAVEPEQADDAGVVAHRHRVLVVVDGAAPIDPARLAELYDLGPVCGIHVVFVGLSRNVLPRACGMVVVAGATADTSTAGLASTGEVVEHVTLEGLSVDDAEAVARSLSPIVDISAPVEDEADIPSRVSLVEVLGGPHLMTDSTVVAERWAESVSLVAVFGQMAGAALRLDMRVDGPHALVAGTTGAGKSELLQSYISALALTHSPRRVNFLLVDYKGGAAFKECRDLPHSVGLVTDLNTQEVRRVLISLNAEIRRREHLLEASGAKDLIAHEELGRSDTPANLIIIVDEFAALAKEVPEFVAGVVDLAQRGRSLGMHLLLATQRPAGVITDNIRANTNLRIALRVADDSESTDVIGVPTAASISRNTPGRGVYRAGPKEIRAFQAGYVGGRTSLTQRPIAVDVGEFSTEGLRPLPAPASSAPARKGEPRPGAGETPDEGPTDLQRIVQVTMATAKELDLPAPHRPWLDPLPALLPLRDLVESLPPVDVGCVLIGTIDDPERQLQRPAVLDLARTGSVLVVGTGRSGKTALLRTIAAAIALQGGERMDVYAIDFAGRGLSMLADLPHVGAVIAGDDGEGIVRLFAMLRDTIVRRYDRFAVSGLSDLADYHRRTGDCSERRIVVLLDGLQSFDAAFERIDRGELTEELPQLIAEGRAAGIHFVLTADRRAGVRSAIFGLLSTVVVLRQSSSDELSNLNLRGDALALDAPPGRCWIGAFEGHLALLGDPEADGQAQALAELALAGTDGERAPRIGRIPIDVRAADLPPLVEAAPRGSVVLGIDGVVLAPVLVDVLHEHLLVCGPRRSGRTSTLATLAAAVAAQPWSPPLYLCTPMESKLSDAAPWKRVAHGADASLELVEALRDGPSGRKGSPILIIDDLEDLSDTLEQVLVELLADRRMPVHVIAAAEARKVRGAYGGSPLGELRQAKHAVLLQPAMPDDNDMFDVRLLASSVLRFPAGRGFLVDTDTATLVQVAQP